MSRHRVAVTGIGAVTPIGIGVDALWRGVLRSESAVGPITRFDTSLFRSRVGAEVKDFEPEAFMDTRKTRRLERFSQFALASARMALEDGRLKPNLVDSDRAGVFMGSALGGIGFAEEQYGRALSGGPAAVNPMLALSVYGAASSCNIAIELGFTGPNTTNSNSCASGAMALGEAMDQIRWGHLDLALAGGAECPLSWLCFGAFAIIRAMSTRNDDPKTACRPFDAERDGFVMGEGAAVLLLESEEHALRRGAPIYCELKGFSRTCDAYHMTAPLPSAEQSARAIRLALDDARVPPEAIDAISAHGSSTPLNDKTETLAIKKALGQHAYHVPVSATKALHAHALGASGAIEAAISALAIHHAILPATANLRNPDPACDLDYVPEGPRKQQVTNLLSNSFGFGGVNACLVLSAWQ